MLSKMQRLFEEHHRETPEKLVGRLTVQLRNHALWDSLLIFFPPLLLAVYLVTYLYRAAWISQATFFLAAFAAAGIGLLAVLARFRPLVPSAPSAARLVDEHAGAKDRFLTLATIEPSLRPASFVARLRQEAAEFLDRIELKRDFPYKLKHSFYWSLIGSVVAAVLFHLLLPNAYSNIHPLPAHGRIRDLAEKMAQRSQLSELARGLQALAAKLENPKVSRPEQQKLILELQKQVEEQRNREDQKDNHDLLGQAASTLQGVEQQSGDGQNQQKDQDKGGGGIQSNLPQEGKGEGKQSQGNGGDSKGDLHAQLSKEMQQGKSAQGDPKEQGREKNQQSEGDGKSNEPDPNKPDSDKRGETTGKTQGGAEEKVGKSKASEEVPQGAPPPERFYQAGERGKESIKGARYITVQLPEEAVADSEGKSSGSRESKRGKALPHIPVSNVPLPAHVPDAPTEKQQMPLEYRGIIR